MLTTTPVRVRSNECVLHIFRPRPLFFPIPTAVYPIGAQAPNMMDVEVPPSLNFLLQLHSSLTHQHDMFSRILPFSRRRRLAATLGMIVSPGSRCGAFPHYFPLVSALMIPFTRATGFRATGATAVRKILALHPPTRSFESWQPPAAWFMMMAFRLTINRECSPSPSRYACNSFGAPDVPEQPIEVRFA